VIFSLFSQPFLEGEIFSVWQKEKVKMNDFGQKCRFFEVLRTRIKLIKKQYWPEKSQN